MTGALDALSVRTIRIQAVLAQMKFDITQFSVAPGEDVEIVFVNADHMPHNLLITAPGKLEDVSLKAEAMASQPDGFQKHFVPDTPDVLHATKLINHDEIARLRFTRADREGQLPVRLHVPRSLADDERRDGGGDSRRRPSEARVTSEHGAGRSAERTQASACQASGRPEACAAFACSLLALAAVTSLPSPGHAARAARRLRHRRRRVPVRRSRCR